MALVTYEDPVILDSTGQAIVSALQDIAASGGGGGGASSTSIAPIETTTTASKAYAVGDLMFYNNILYKVTSPIVQGGTIEISGATPNVIQTDIDSELKNKIKLSSTSGLVKNDGTIDTTTYVSDISGKADKVASATNGDVATLDSNGNLVDSGIASTNVVVKSATAGLLKNDGSIDTTTTAAVSANTTAISNIKDGTSIDSFGDVETALGDKLDVTRVAPPFYDDVAYTKGQYVTRNGFILRFKTDHSAGAFNPQEVIGVTIGEVLADKEYITNYNSGDFLVVTSDDLTTGYTTNDVALNKSTIPTQNDTKPITSGAVYTALGNKQDTISDLATIRSGASAGATAYQKPQTGIPSTDLASGVIPDVTGKADKVSNPTNGNFAGLDSNGNLTDSGKKASDFLPSNTPIPSVSVSHTGTASSTTVRKQIITVDNVSYDVDGSAYLENNNVTLSTSQATTVTFTNAIITDGKTLTLETSLWALVPDDMVTTAGVCTITLPKWSSATTIGVRLRVR